MTIAEAVTDADILATRDVMRMLRPHVAADAYLGMVKEMMTKDGYRLVAARDDTTVRAVAGFRYMTMLHCGKILYVDDLITDDRTRSQGFGKAILDWLKRTAREAGCSQLHLDSGVHRKDAHRFYFRERLTIGGYHFSVELD